MTIEGKTKETGKVVSKYEEVFDVTVKYFEGKIDFVQVVKLNANVKQISAVTLSIWHVMMSNVRHRKEYSSA